MARIFVHCTAGAENPTKAGFAWLMTKGFIEAGHKPEITLAGEGAILAKKVVAENIQPVGFPSLMELISVAMEHKVPIHI